MSDPRPLDKGLPGDPDTSVVEDAPTAEEDEVSPIQIDAYGIKAPVKPRPHGERKPKSWKEVGRAVNLKLMSIAVNLVGVIDDSLDGSRNLIRGLCAIPKAVARRIDRAHQKADRAEARKQEEVEAGTLPPLAPEVAIDNLEACLAALQADGAAVEVRKLEDGRVAIMIMKPGDRPLAAELIRKALPSPIEVEQASGTNAPSVDPATAATKKPSGRKPSRRKAKES